MMTRRIGLLLVLVAALSTPRNAEAQAPELNIRDAAQSLVERFVDERQLPWRFVFAPNGKMWWWQNAVKDPLVYWDTGAEVLMEIARGRGHRIWLGAIYRETVGYDPTQTITPLDPRHIDVAETFGWRWRIGKRLRILSYWERWCFHEIDVHITSAVFFTTSSIGIGTLSPMEEGEVLTDVRRVGKPRVDGYIFAGPVISGGPEDILGLTTTYQGEGKAQLQLAWPVTHTLVVEFRARWETLLLHENADLRDRHRGDLRLTFAAVRDAGEVTLFIGRTVKDNYIDRRSPISSYLGMAYRF